MTTVSPVLDALTLNRYHLKVKGCTAPLDVESFQGREGLSTRYRYDVVLTSADKDIDPSVMLMKNVTFIMQTLPEAAFRRTRCAGSPAHRVRRHHPFLSSFRFGG